MVNVSPTPDLRHLRLQEVRAKVAEGLAAIDSGDVQVTDQILARGRRSPRGGS
jgi:hypothetical protein